MSDVETAQTGAPVASADVPAVQDAPQQAQESTTEQVDTQQSDQPRDEKGRFVPQERVNEITRARREAERNWQSERERREQLEQRLAQYERQPQPEAQAPDVPTPEQFGYDLAEWGRAMAEHNRREVDRLVAERLQGQEAQAKQRQMASTFEERAKAYAAEHPEFEQRLVELDSTVRLQPEVVEAIAYNDHGPALVMYLAEHLDEADRISRLPPHLAAVQLGRIEALVSAPKPSKPVTKAPDPVPTVGGGATATKDPDRMTTDEWLAWRNSQR